MAKKKKTDSSWRNTFFYFLLLLIALSLFAPFLGAPRNISEVNFSDFLNQVDQGKISQITVKGDMVEGKYTDGKAFRTRALNYPNLVQNLREKGVSIKVEEPADSSWVFNLFIQVLLPLLFFVGLWFLIMRQAQGVNSQAMSFGMYKGKAVTNKAEVTFKDVAGVDEAKEELAEIVDFLKHPEKFRALGARIPRGLLLVGAPGTGKTLLARAIAGEAGVPFFSLSGSDFVEMFVGVGASRVRSLFNQAKKQAPSIIFMDEIDAVGRHRGAGLGGGHDEREQTLNQLLVEMDGFDANTNIIIIAATNRPDILDPALLRPGRFDRTVTIDKPDVKGRKAILEIHSKGKPLGKDMTLDIIARRTPGFTGADLANIMNEAAILAARCNKKEINMPDAEEAVDRVMAGPQKKSRVMQEKEKKVIAYHEVGHALLSKLLPNVDSVHKISILPRGMALGYTLQLPEQDKHLLSKSEAVEQIVVLLGGRVAEEIVFGEITSGAQNDLERATAMAKKMVCEMGMSSLGLRTFGHRDRQVFLGRDFGETKDYGDITADAIDKEINNIINDCYQKAKEILTKNRSQMDEVAVLLMEKETLEGENLAEVLKSLMV